MTRNEVTSFFVAIVISFGAYAADSSANPTGQQIEMHQSNYVPGMGEIMGLTQMRHSKL